MWPKLDVCFVLTLERVHLGIALGCHFALENAGWQARYWVEHMDKAHPDAHKFEIVQSGTKPTVSSMKADLFVSEETYVIPAPGFEPTVKMEVCDTTQEDDEIAC